VEKAKKIFFFRPLAFSADAMIFRVMQYRYIEEKIFSQCGVYAQNFLADTINILTDLNDKMHQKKK
jgi:hypothetical protein